MAYVTIIFIYREREPFPFYAKFRIGPIKKMTITQLELLAIITGERAGRFLLNQLGLENAKIIYGDLLMVIYGLVPSVHYSELYPKIIQNRVKDIRRL